MPNDRHAYRRRSALWAPLMDAAKKKIAWLPGTGSIRFADSFLFLESILYFTRFVGIPNPQLCDLLHIAAALVQEQR